MAKPSRREFMAVCGAAASLATTAPASAQAKSTQQQVWPSTFPALKQTVNGQPLAFLDSAATTLRPQSVIDALVDYYSTDNANPAKVHRLAARSAERLSLARAEV